MVMLLMVHNLQVSNRNEVQDGAPRTSSEKERGGHAAVVIVNDLKDILVPTVNTG